MTNQLTPERIEAFIADFEQLCAKHGIELGTPGGYDPPSFFPLSAGDAPPKYWYDLGAIIENAPAWFNLKKHGSGAAK